MYTTRAVVFQLYSGEPIDRLLRRFKNKVRAADIMGDLRKAEFYEKPSTKRRRVKLTGKAKNK